METILESGAGENVFGTRDRDKCCRVSASFRHVILSARDTSAPKISCMHQLVPTLESICRESF